jgi:putative PEP-CTERM system histidine kinase
MLDLESMLQFAATLAMLGLALYAGLREKRSLVRHAFMAGVVLLAVEAFLSALASHALMPVEMARIERVRLLVLSFVPGVWLLFSLVYARGNFEEFLQRWRHVLRFAFLVPPILALAFWNGLIVGGVRLPDGVHWALELGQPGMLLLALVVVVLAAVLMNLENTLRASTGTMRWRIKFMVLGLCLLFAARIFTLSQALLYSSINLEIEVVNAGALLVACVFMAKSLHRSDLMKVDLYLSHRLIYTSITVVLVGVYLLVVGAMAQVVTHFGGTAAFPVKALVVFVAVLGLTVLMLSDRIRLLSKRMVSRHFRRPLHDYRATWAAFTRRTVSLRERGAFCRELTRFVSETFETLSVTIWLVAEDREGLVFGASTSMSDAQARDVGASVRLAPAVLADLAKLEQPVDLDRARGGWVDALKACNPDFFNKGGTRLCMPLVAGGQLLGLMIMGDRVGGMVYTMEDADLFKTLCDQAAANLLGIRLSEQLLQAKEIEAFQTMSTFFIHDLKNTASTLSLMLQNLPRHFEDPAFREDALKAMGKSVAKINDVIRRLTSLRRKLEIRPVETDLNAWVRGVLAGIEGPENRRVIQELNPLPPVPLDPDHMGSVVTNLVLNAQHAVRDGGSVVLRTEAREGWVVLSVVDTGCGIAREFLEKQLFRPFQTTRKEGMGIGLFQSRMIVAAHHGRVEVESEVGKGSTFRVMLPVLSLENSRGQESRTL